MTHMLSKTNLLLAVPPTEMMAAQGFGLTLAHMAYRVGGGPHLFRANLPVPVRGGVMLIDDAGFDGRGDPAPFCQEVVRECAARGFRGAVCDFEQGGVPLLDQVVRRLGEGFARRGWTLYVTEPYGHSSPRARVMIPSALSGGSLSRRLEEAAERFGRERVTLAVQRVAEDFFLPSPTGSGVPLSRRELEEKLEQLHPSVFFSHELCARYFTYMSRESGAHFVLFDDRDTLRKKLEVAQELGITSAVAALPEVLDAAGELGIRN